MKKTAIQITLVSATVVLLSGCAAVMLAPLVGGLTSAEVTVETDPSTITPEVKSAISSSKKVLFQVPNSDQQAVYFAETIEKKAPDIVIETSDTPATMTPSQRRRLMAENCNGKFKPDLVISYSAGTTDANAGTTIVGAVTGRVSYKATLEITLYRCIEKNYMTMVTKASIGSGTYNADQTKLHQFIGEAWAIDYLRIAGKLPALAVK